MNPIDFSSIYFSLVKQKNAYQFFRLTKLIFRALPENYKNPILTESSFYRRQIFWINRSKNVFEHFLENFNQKLRFFLERAPLTISLYLRRRHLWTKLGPISQECLMRGIRLLLFFFRKNATWLCPHAWIPLIFLPSTSRNKAKGTMALAGYHNLIAIYLKKSLRDLGSIESENCLNIEKNWYAFLFVFHVILDALDLIRQ